MTSFFKSCYASLVDCAKSPSTFGEKVEYRPLTGGRYSLYAVFDQNFEQIDPNTEAVVSVNQPRIEVKTEDLPKGKACQGDIVRIYNSDRNRHESYRVNEVQEDGIGAVVLFLTLKDEDIVSGESTT